MGALLAEFLKLRRSLSWAVVVLFPLSMAVSASVNTLASGQPLRHGWHTLWLRSVVFYGLFPLAVGVSILGSLVWRVEHRGGNWNALMSSPIRSLQVVVAKSAAVALLVAVMQMVLLAGVMAVGKLLFGLPGLLPVRYVLIAAVIALAIVPLAALQSALSMALRSFAAPVAVALVGAAGSVVLLLAKVPGVVLVSPYALASRVTQLGTGTFADDGVFTVASVAPLLAASLALTVAVTALATRLLDRSDAVG